MRTFKAYSERRDENYAHGLSAMLRTPSLNGEVNYYVANDEGLSCAILNILSLNLIFSPFVS